MFEKKIIDDFRKQANMLDWACITYSNRFRDGKQRDDWSLICSAMDWIDVAARYLRNYPLPRYRAESMEVLTYILSIDNIVEAVTQLHSVILPSEQKVFFGENDCFPDNEFRMNDYEYFKRIRACFGVHPVDIGNRKGEKRMFASWSGDFSLSGDFAVMLYSENVGEDYLSLDISFNQLNKYGEKYYNHLVNLRDELDRQLVEYIEQKKNELFECTGNPVERLNVLYHENNTRLFSASYNGTIEKLHLIFSEPITNEHNVRMVEIYREALSSGIDDIQSNLQSMQYDRLKCEELLPPSIKSLPKGWGYPFSKLSSAVFDTSGREMFIFENEIEELFRGRFVFEYDSLKELYVLVNAAMYSMLLEDQEA
ncbi:MAG: hypothetical protein IKX16_02530 [Clostridia bacterium]|nr:hypothetical protein [Clostridia bacterium]